MIAHEELEAVVRAQVTRAIAMTLELDEVPPPTLLNRVTDTIMRAADAYAAGDGEALAEARRAVLHRESRP